jgi:dipeptidyl aminopeptidase/acylaminoacyl peptidase
VRIVAMIVVALFIAPSARADVLLYRCGDNVCRVGDDGHGREQLTTGGGYSWLSASRDGSRLAVSKATFAYVLDGSGRQLGGALPRGGAALVAQVSPDGRLVATLELLGELSPPPINAPPGSPPTLGFHPYLFVAAPDGTGREVAARDVTDAAWLGGRIVRSDGSSQPPYPRGLCVLASNADFACERDVARDPANDLTGPALSPDGRLLAAARAPADANRGTGPIGLFDAGSGALVRPLTTGDADGLPSFSPDGRQVAFTRDRDIYAVGIGGGTPHRVVAGGVQPIWVSGCVFARAVKPKVRGRSVTVTACAPGPGRLTVTLTRRGRRVARRTVTAARAGTVTVRLNRPRGTGALRAKIRFSS